MAVVQGGSFFGQEDHYVSQWLLRSSIQCSVKINIILITVHCSQTSFFHYLPTFFCRPTYFRLLEQRVFNIRLTGIRKKMRQSFYSISLPQLVSFFKSVRRYINISCETGENVSSMEELGVLVLEMRRFFSVVQK